MESLTGDSGTDQASGSGGRFKSVTGWCLGVALGALAGIIVGLLLGVGVAMMLGVL